MTKLQLITIFKQIDMNTKYWYKDWYLMNICRN